MEKAWGGFETVAMCRVTTIGDSAFAACGGLTNIFLGRRVAYVGFSALRFCYNLTGVYFAGDAPVFDPNFDFYESPNVVTYYLPGTVGWGATLGVNRPRLGSVRIR